MAELSQEQLTAAIQSRLQEAQNALDAIKNRKMEILRDRKEIRAELLKAIQDGNSEEQASKYVDLEELNIVLHSMSNLREKQKNLEDRIGYLETWLKAVPPEAVIGKATTLAECEDAFAQASTNRAARKDAHNIKAQNLYGQRVTAVDNYRLNFRKSQLHTLQQDQEQIAADKESMQAAEAQLKQLGVSAKDIEQDLIEEQQDNEKVSEVVILEAGKKSIMRTKLEETARGHINHAAAAAAAAVQPPKGKQLGNEPREE